MVIIEVKSKINKINEVLYLKEVSDVVECKAIKNEREYLCQPHKLEFQEGN